MFLEHVSVLFALVESDQCFFGQCYAELMILAACANIGVL